MARAATRAGNADGFLALEKLFGLASHDGGEHGQHAGLVAAAFEAIMTLLEQGVTSRTELTQFAEDTCGSAFRKALVFEGASEQAAQAYVHLQAKEHMALVLNRLNQ